MQFLSKFLVCVFILGIALYAYIQEQNQLTELRMRVPDLTRKLQLLQDENTRLQCEIEKFESPINLMELARKPEFGHLKHPYTPDIINVELPADES